MAGSRVGRAGQADGFRRVVESSSGCCQSFTVPSLSVPVASAQFHAHQQNHNNLMKNILTKSILITSLLAAGIAPVQAQIRITEVAPWGGATTGLVIPPYATDWFELTNLDLFSVTITGWQMDDNSNGTGKVNLTGITSIAAGESVIFTENAATASFLNTWFGGTPPAGLQIGNYTGSAVGLSQTGDAVNIYDGSAVLQANVVFSSSDATAPFQTFDNTAALNNTTISTLSLVGTNGAFVAVNDSGEIGSPGVVPEPGSLALLLGGAALLGLRRRRN